jgi:hypothetical protein
LFVRRVSILAQNALHENPAVSPYILPDSPVDRRILSHRFDELARDHP